MNKTCQHFPTCSGCSMDLSEPVPPVWKEVLAFFNERQLAIDLFAGPPKHWRCRSKLAVRGSSQDPQIGLFKERSHDVVSIPHCLVHHPHINAAVDRVKKLIHEHHLEPYNEITGKGDIRYLQCVIERKTGKIQLTVVLNKRVELYQKLLSNIFIEEPERWHSIWINLNSIKTNSIFGPTWILCQGEELLWEQFGDISVCYQPASFAQANLDLFEKMLFRIKDLVPEHAKVAEFYAGVGVIGLFLAQKSSWIRCAEINPHSEECFSRSRSCLDPAIANKISFHTGSAKELLSILSESTTVVVDPPRKGLDPQLLEAITNTSTVSQLVYVSCGWESFKKDCALLLQSGWKLSYAAGYLFFPGSNHIEILANFQR